MEKTEIIQKLQEFRQNDIPWRKGRLFSYVYYLDKETEDIGKLAYMEYLTENGIDATAFPSLSHMENEVIHFCKNILRADNDVVGTMTTGGTESIMLAVKTARDRATALNPLQTKFEIIVPETIHAAFYKAAHYFGVTAITVKVDDTSYKATAGLIEPFINDNTILIAASAISYAYGLVDEIKEIGALALRKNIPFHVDGCIGGFILATARIGGFLTEDFDFTVPGVTSLSMDLHKYAYCPKGASVLLFKNDTFRKYQVYVNNDWTGYTFINTGILSSKTGGPIAAAWAVTNFLGIQRYTEIAIRTIEVAQEIRRKLSEHPEIKMLADPRYSLISFTTPNINIYALSDELKSKQWYAGLQLKHRHIPTNIHLTIAAHHFDNYKEFISDLFDAIEKVKINNPALLEVDVTQVDFAEIDELLPKLGVDENGLPANLALINQALENLPKNVSKELMLGFIQSIYK